MKYWAYLGAKLAVAGVFLYGLWHLIVVLLPTFEAMESQPFVEYLITVILFPLLCFAILLLILRDQFLRCRTCGRRMRMPLEKGSFSHLFMRGRPRLEYICIYGHGTLKVPEERVTGSGASDWQPHSDDIWKELEHSTREQ
jgi:hypothetical protein